MSFSGLRHDLKAAFSGTIGSGVSAFSLLPLTSECVKRQVNLSRSRSDFVRDIFSRKAISSLYKLSGKAVIHAVTRSFAFLGVGNVVLQRMSQEESAVKRGLTAGMCAGASQAILTTWFSHSVIAGISNRPQLSFSYLVRNSSLFRRIYSVALTKNAADQGLALMASQVMKKYMLEEDILNRGLACSFVSGFFGAALSTLLFMPLVSAETNILSQPERSLKKWAYEVASKNDPRLLWRGGGFRVIRASFGLGIGLAVTEKVDDFYSYSLLGSPVK